ncbi:MAG: phospholipase D family protein [Bacteroidetes bacterium]|nr:phospholipase D family protein [Bacteroidota bacterium]
MAKFYQGTHLSAKLERLVERADDFLYIVSPFIKLHRRFRDELDKKRNNPKLEITVLFGKNEHDLSRSLQEDDFDYLASFPNIKIVYDKDLHAKYYASEDSALITSLNLHEFSQNNNIEAGVMLMPDEEAYKESLDYFKNIISKGDVLFENKPGLKNTASNQNRQTGYCIRTGEPIPFNPERPMSYNAYQVWAQFGDWDYPEKFCHKTGRPSNGRTSMRKPVL